MDKENLASNNVVFLINNKEESEYIQKYLFDLGFVWKWYPAPSLAHSNYPLLFYCFCGPYNIQYNTNSYYISYTEYLYYDFENRYKLVKASKVLRKYKLDLMK